MKKIALMATVVLGLAVSEGAQAQVLPTVAGGVLGGLAGSIYASGVQATGAALSAATTSTVSALGSVAPAATTATVGVISAASAPVLIGVVAGGAVGYLLTR